MKEQKISRRTFLKGATAGMAGIAVTGILGGCTSTAETTAAATAAGTQPSEEPAAQETAKSYTYADTIAWDAEYDVLVLGMGAAGCAAAKTAADEGAKVLVVEKMPEAYAGGNSKVCGQLFVYGHDDPESTLAYLKALCGSRQIPEDMLEVFANGVASIADILADDFEFNKEEFMEWTEILPIGRWSPEYPEMPGSDKIALVTAHAGAADSYLYTNLKQRLLDRADYIDIWYDSPAEELIQDPISKAVIGVRVSRGGSIRNVRALNGVVICTGGFEDNKEMVQDYLDIIDYAPIGGLYNTGDGIKMCQKIGADLWHMAVSEGGFGLGGACYNVPEGQNAVSIESLTRGPLNTGSCILVGTDGDRFLNESEIIRHGHMYHNGLWQVPRYPEKMFLIFDQTQYELIEEAKAIPEQFQGDVMAFDTIAQIAEATGCKEDQLTDTI